MVVPGCQVRRAIGWNLVAVLQLYTICISFNDKNNYQFPALLSKSWANMPIWECDLEFWSGYISCGFQSVPEADSVILVRFDPGKVQMLQCVASTLAVRKIQSGPWTFFYLSYMTFVPWSRNKSRQSDKSWIFPHRNIHTVEQSP